MRSTIARIDLDALRWNLSTIRTKVGAGRVCAMVKANAYGHGMIECSKVLAEEGVDFLGVALVQEAIILRKAGIVVPILVLTPNEPAEAELVAEHQLTVVICSVKQAELLGKAAYGKGVVDGHLYVDTGMHRDGFLAHEVVDALEEIDAIGGVEISGICTHLATSDVHCDSFISEQLTLLHTVLSRCERRGRTFANIHAANTGAICQSPEALFTLSRPGLSLYGYASPNVDNLPLRPVMSVQSSVLSLRTIGAGESVGYGRRFVASTTTTIATVPIGYGDGYMRALSGKAECLIGGQRCRVVGTVCMDEIMVDVSHINVAIGDKVVLLGMQAEQDGTTRCISALELAQWADTIAYEITTAVNARVPRVFIGERGL